MYIFHINENGPEIDITIMRALLALSAIAALIYRSDKYFFINLLCFLLLLFAAIFIKIILKKFKVNKFFLLIISSTILFIATHSIAFAIIILVYGCLATFLNKKSVLEVTNKGVNIKKLFASPAYPWSQFSNVVLKDNLLTLDFVNNKLVQLKIDEKDAIIDENIFNEFCKKFIKQVPNTLPS